MLDTRAALQRKVISWWAEQMPKELLRPLKGNAKIILRFLLKLRAKIEARKAKHDLAIFVYSTVE